MIIEDKNLDSNTLTNVANNAYVKMSQNEKVAKLTKKTETREIAEQVLSAFAWNG